MGFEFDWDPDKNEHTFSRHGIYFDEAAVISDDPLRIELLSLRESSAEIRRLILGRRGEDILAVICTDRDPEKKNDFCKKGEPG